MIKDKLYKSFALIIRITPMFILYLISFLISRIAFCLWRKRRKIAFDNIKRVFSDKSDREVNKMIKDNFYELSKTFFEIFKQPIFYKIKNGISVKGIDNLKKSYSKGKGVILVTLHHGNWEFAGSYTGSQGYPISVVQKKQKNKEFDHLLNSYREKNGMKIIGRKTALKEGVKELKKGNILTIVIDQKAHTGGIQVPFFGLESPTSPLAAKLHKKYKSPIIFMICTRKGLNSYDLVYSEELNFPEKDIYDITELLNKRSEEYIKENPKQWFWGHKRWG